MKTQYRIFISKLRNLFNGISSDLNFLYGLIGRDIADNRIKELELEFPNMNEDWYIRTVIKTHKF